MKKIILAASLFFGLLHGLPVYAETSTYEVSTKDIYDGYIVQKVWLNTYAVPDVSVSGVAFTPVANPPKGILLSDPEKFTVKIGMERKQPFAIIYIPAYMLDNASGKVNQVSSYILSVNEKAQTESAHNAERTTDNNRSVLASGTWYKIGVTKTGFYKIDKAFITSMGVNPANIGPGSIRIFGNGGTMLSENNAVSRPVDLKENAIQVNENGDNVFDNGESVIFYAVGPTGWQKDSANQRFTHLKNLYTDTAYYFVTFDQGAGMRVAGQGSIGSANVNVSSFNYYDVHDEDLVNPAGLGKLWLGEQFYTQLGTNTQTFNFDMGTSVADVFCTVSVGARSGIAGSSFNISMNGANMGTASFTNATTGDIVMTLSGGSWNVPCNSQVAGVTLRFNPAESGSIGYLNYIEINTRRNLIVTGDQMNFRDWQSVGAGKIASYQVQGAGGSTSVWDVTDPQVPVAMSGSLSGGTYTFRQDAAMLHEFAVMNSGNLFTPKFIGGVANQNLHESGTVDGIIVTAPEFLGQANRLAEHHRQHDHLSVVVATTEQVYNEFSSGGQDISAIRDFARMYYKKAGTDTSKMPRYMLLFGGASYDYKNRLPNNSNFVPVFESAESTSDLEYYSTDDFFGFLDDNENIEDIKINTLDIGVGRLPARTASDAASLVDKVISYTDAATLGPWRIMSTFVADNADQAGNHMQDAEDMAAVVTTETSNLYNQEKVYVDAIPNIATPAGERCPNANASINDDVYKGTFMMNYNGHGNPTVWATERILTQDDYNKWANKNMLPFMVTATCDFGQYDHPQFVSAAEQLVIRKGGGTIAILTTTQAVYAVYNHPLNVQYLEAQFSRNVNDEWNTFGDANRIGKNITYAVFTESGRLANFRKFSLLGDPMLTPAFPLHHVQLDSVTDGFSMRKADTIKALGAYIVSGSIKDYHDSHLLTDFNGMLSVSIYDKPRVINTIKGTGAKFKLQDNLVYKGRVSVTNGKFSFTFIAPKDINYYFGNGKISTYAHNGITDAAGADSNIAIGGFSDHPQYNTNPPLVRAYINDSLFQNGGITGTNTSLYIGLYSETGINVTGNNVGHDLVAVLDGQKEQPYILNDYYETAPNTYQRGSVTFPLNGLANGKHSMTVTAWDVNDNVGYGTVDFVVIDGKIMNIQNLGNYPNPFSDITHFVFEHNHPDETLSVQLTIFGTDGSLVRRIAQDFTPSGSRTAELTWDGTTNEGRKLASGVYVYRLDISTEKGYKSTAYQKLVIVR